MDIMELMTAAAVIQAAFDSVDDIGILMSSIGCCLDFWAVAHGCSAEDLEKALENLVDVSKKAHSMIGMPGEEE